MSNFYVDHAQVAMRVAGRPGPWSNLYADDRDELLAFARQIGLPFDQYQPKCRTEQAADCPHFLFKVTDAQRTKAIFAGAQPVTIQRAAALARERRTARAVATVGAAPAGVPGPDKPKRAAAWSPVHQHHSWIQDREHHKHCDFCGIKVQNNRGERGRWWEGWTWPDNRTGNNYPDGRGGLPKCPGPPSEEAAQGALLCSCGQPAEHRCRATGQCQDVCPGWCCEPGRQQQEDRPSCG